jgi:hypothetical protein
MAHKQPKPVYPRSITIELEGKCAFASTGTQKVDDGLRGRLVVFPNEGDYRLSLATASGRPLTQTGGFVTLTAITSGLLTFPAPTAVNTDFVFSTGDDGTDQPTDKPTDQPTDKPTDQPTDKPTDGSGEVFQLQFGEWGFNFLDLTDGEYILDSRLDLGSGFADVTSQVARIGTNAFRAELNARIELSQQGASDLTHQLPFQATFVDAGEGRTLGRSRVHWLRADGAIVPASLQLLAKFANKNARVKAPVMFSHLMGPTLIGRMPLNASLNGSSLSLRPVDV